MKILNPLLLALLFLPTHAHAQAVGGNGTVQGTAPSGNTAAGNPLQFGGVDATGKMRPLLVNTDGTLHVTGSAAASSVSITNQAGSNFLAVNGSGQIALSNFPATQAVTQSGSWLDGILGVNGTGIATAANPFPVYLQASTSVIGHVITDSGSTTAVTSLPSIPAGSNAIGSVSISNFPSTQPVSGTVAATQSGTWSTGRTWTLGSGTDSVTTVPSGTQTVSGTVAATQSGSWTNTVTQATGSNLHVQVDTAPTTTVTGTVTANAGTGTFAVSAATLPLPTGAATAANQANVQGTAGSPATTVLSVQGVAGGTAQPISASSLPLPTGAAQDSTLTGGTQKTQIVGSTGNVGGVDANGNQQVAGSTTEVIGTAATTVGTDVISAMRVDGYTWGSFQYGSGTGTLQFQGSNDNVNYNNLVVNNVSVTGGGVTTGVAGAGISYFPINFKWLRVRVTATAASLSTVLELFTLPRTLNNSAVLAIQSGTWTVQPGNTPNTTPWLVTQTPATSGGSSFLKILSAATTNATSGKTSAGQVFGWNISNSNGAFRYIHFYNKASAPTVGTDVPVITIGIPAGGTVAFHDENGLAFSTGIAYSLTTGFADTDNTAVAAGDLTGVVSYKFCLPVARFVTWHGHKTRRYAA